MENEIQRAIEVLKTVQICRTSNYYPDCCDDCPYAEKCFTNKEEKEALKLAIAALERQEKEPCGYCKPEPGIQKAQGVDCWRIDGELSEERHGFAAKFCGNCGRDLRKLEGVAMGHDMVCCKICGEYKFYDSDDISVWGICKECQGRKKIKIIIFVRIAVGSWRDRNEKRCIML